MNKRPVRNRFLRKMGSAACLLAVLTTLGGHWLALQSVAWVRMIAHYAQEGPLTTALAKTFDGRHPCALCTIVREGRQQEQREQGERAWVRFSEGPDLLCDLRPAPIPLPPDTATPAVPFVPGWHRDFSETPPAPPPRAA